jgi:nucleotide-binding universal stress UspA family protein
MTFQRILVPLDGSPLAEEALPHALRLARAFHHPLLLLHVLDVQPSVLEHCPDSPDWRLRRLQAQRYLEAVIQRLDAADVTVEWHLAEGRAAGQIVEFIRDHEIGLLVLCAYGWGGASEFPFGGTVHKVLTTTEASYVLVRPDHVARAGRQPYRRVLVPLDGSRAAEGAVSLAAGIAADSSAEVVLLQIVRAPEMPRHRPLTREESELSGKVVECNRREAAAYLADVDSRVGDGCRARTRLVVSPLLAETIERVANEEQADLIVLTAHGAAEHDDYGIGPTCHAVLARSARPVLVLQHLRAPMGLNRGRAAANEIRAPRAAPH